MKSYIWSFKPRDRGIAGIREFPDALEGTRYCLRTGKSAVGLIPDDLVFQLSEDAGVRITDVVSNLIGGLFVSGDLMKFLRENTQCEIEYHRIRLRNIKRKIHPKEYFFANVIGSIKCVDMDRSVYEMDSLIEENFFSFKTIVLDESQLQDCRIFRLGGKPKLIIVREDLKDLLVDAGFSGLRFDEIGEGMKGLWI